MSDSLRCSFVAPEAARVGVRFQCAEILGVHPARRSAALEEAKKAAVEAASAVDPERSEVLAGYRELLDSVNAVDEIASPLLLLRSVLRNGRLPRVNTVVDAYNLVSLTTLMVASAHDGDRVQGNPRIVMTTGSELFHPLGSDTTVTLPAGQWAGVADDHVLCHCNCKQSELSKVTLDTRNLLIYVQGHRRTSDEHVAGTLRVVCETIVQFNGGTIRYLEPCR